MWYKFVFAGRNEVLDILGSDEQGLASVRQITAVPKLQLVAAYFLSQGYGEPTIKSIVSRLESIIARKPIPVAANKNGVFFNGKTYSDLNSLEDEINAFYTLIPRKKEQEKSQYSETPQVIPGKIQVFKAQNHADNCVLSQYGKFCIGNPNDPHYDGFRHGYQATYYYVFDGTLPDDDPQQVMIVCMKSGNKIQITDKNNKSSGTAAGEEYMKYLESKGVDTSQFQSEPLSKEEQERYNTTKDNESLDWFKNLSYHGKEIYVGRESGGVLTDEQFQYLLNNNAEDLLKVYLNSGKHIPEAQIAMLSTNLQKTYNRRRNIKLESLVGGRSLEDAGRILLETDIHLLPLLLPKGLDVDDLIQKVRDRMTRQLPDYQIERLNNKIQYLQGLKSA